MDAVTDAVLDTLVADRYRLLDILGRGGMGVVYRARDERLQRLVAVKIANERDPDLMRRLRREADVLADLSHPNVVQVFDAGEYDGRPFIVTELLTGTSLRALLGAGRLEEADIAACASQMAGALAAAHERGIVHRDLKPENVIISPAGRVQLVDFGIAQRAGDTQLTAPQSVIGTAAYLSPEQLRGLGAVPASDVYALGLVLIECLTGRPAFAGTVAESIGARLVDSPTLPDAVPAPWRTLLGGMTALDPADRPSALEVARDVAALDGVKLDPSRWAPATHVFGAPATIAGPTAAAAAGTAPMVAASGATTVLSDAAVPTALMPAASAEAFAPTGVLPIAPAPPSTALPPPPRRGVTSRVPVVLGLLALALVVALVLAAVVIGPTDRTDTNGPPVGPEAPAAVTTAPTSTTAPPTTVVTTTVPEPPTTVAPPTTKAGRGKGDGGKKDD